MRKWIMMSGILALMFYSCQEKQTLDINEGYGKLVVKITDAPFPVELIEKAEITFYKGEIWSDDADSTVKQSLFEDSITVDLIKLQNGVTANLAELQVPSGYYFHARFFVSGASIELKDGSHFDMKVPSGSSSGLKVYIDPPVYVQAGVEAELLLDFDLSRSLVMLGNINTPAGIKGVNFKPVIRAVNNTAAGSVTGKVKDNSGNPLENVNVWLAQDDIVAATNSDEEGHYALIGIPAGQYSLFASAEGYELFSSEISVERGTEVNLDIELNPADSSE